VSLFLPPAALLERASRFRDAWVAHFDCEPYSPPQRLQRWQDFDPDQPRDPSGQWTSGEGGFTPAGPEKRVPYQANRDTIGHYDPRFYRHERMVLEYEGKPVDMEHDQLIPTAPHQGDLPGARSAGIIYRGMAAAEFEAIQATGEVRSKGEYNIGEAQKGLTYYATDPSVAASYASSFAPQQQKADWDRPAYVIAIRQPVDERLRRVQGTSENEVGVIGGVSIDDIVNVYRGDVIARTPLIQGRGIRVAPSVTLHWTELKKRVAAASSDSRRIDAYDPDQPRVPAGEEGGGQWTGEGGGGGGGSPSAAGSGGGASAATGGTGTAHAGAGSNPPYAPAPPRSPVSSSKPYKGRSFRAITSGGRMIFRPTPGFKAYLKTNKATPAHFEELNTRMIRSGTDFRDLQDAIAAAAASTKYGTAVEIKDPDDYRKLRLFTTLDGKAGFALDGDNIVSVFKHHDSKVDNFALSALQLAVDQGGRRLDCFDTVLPQAYAEAGFRAAARLPWNETFKPDGWNKETFAKFNKGEPDIVLMSYDPEHVTTLYAKRGERYARTDGERVTSWSEAEKLQRAYVVNPPMSEDPYVWASRETLMGVHHTLNEARNVAEELGADPKTVMIGKPSDARFVLGGREYMAAGMAYSMDQPPGGHKRGTVLMFPDQLNSGTIAGVTSHEVMHIQYQQVLDALQAESEAMQKALPGVNEPGPDPDKPWKGWMHPDGSLAPPYDKQFPIYERFVKHNLNWQKLADEDGLTDYSTEWWNAVKHSGASTRQGMHETMAEMARLEYELGSVKHTPSWNSYYRDVKKTYKELVKQGRLR
jgi:hypothetical protein